MAELPEPYLKYGLICERVLQEKDGVVSIIRVVDRFTYTIKRPEAPPEMPEWPMNFMIAMNWVGGLGKHEARVRILMPHGETWEGSPMPFFLDSLERGQNITANVSFTAKKEGLYWIEFLLNGQVKGRMPWRIIYHRVEVPGPPGSGEPKQPEKGP